MKKQSKVLAAVTAVLVLSAGAVALATGVFAEEGGGAPVTKDGTRLDKVVLPISVDGVPLKLKVSANSVPNEYCVDVVETDGGGGICAADWDLTKTDTKPTFENPYATGARLDGGKTTPAVLVTIADPARPIRYVNNITKEEVRFQAPLTKVALRIKNHDLVAYVQPYDSNEKPDEDGGFPFRMEYR